MISLPTAISFRPLNPRRALTSRNARASHFWKTPPYELLGELFQVYSVTQGLSVAVFIAVVALTIIPRLLPAPEQKFLAVETFT